MDAAGQMSRELEEVLGELATARDAARSKAHLLSMDTRRRLADLEDEIENFEDRLSTRSDWIAEHVMATARGLTSALRGVAARAEYETVRVRDLMSRDPVTCRVFENLSDAAHRMWEGDFGVLPVVDEQNKPIGMLTDRDICLCAYARGGALSELSVGEAMTRGAQSCKATHTLRAAMDLMVTHQVRRLPVVGEGGALIGIVSLADVARLSQTHAGNAQEARAWMPSVLAGICESIASGPTRTSRAS
jgi:CBS domain-containing protein